VGGGFYVWVLTIILVIFCMLIYVRLFFCFFMLLQHLFLQLFYINLKMLPVNFNPASHRAYMRDQYVLLILLYANMCLLLTS
jgi:hypothetical protein